MRNSLGFLILLLLTFGVQAGETTRVRVQSNHEAQTTVDRLKSVIAEKGMTVFASIDHSNAAEKAGLSLKPTHVVIFGNPKVGTLLMQCDQQAGLDLPLKILVYTDADDKTWLSYAPTDFLAARYAMSDCGKILGNINKALAGLTASAAK